VPSPSLLIGSWVKRFLLEHLVAERNLAHNTQKSYRDTLVLLLPFASAQKRKACTRWPGLLPSAVLNTSSGLDRFVLFPSNGMGAPSCPTSTSRRWMPFWRLRTAPPSTDSVITHCCFLCITRELVPVKSPRYRLRI